MLAEAPREGAWQAVGRYLLIEIEEHLELADRDAQVGLVELVWNLR